MQKNPKRKNQSHCWILGFEFWISSSAWVIDWMLVAGVLLQALR